MEIFFGFIGQVSYYNTNSGIVEQQDMESCLLAIAPMNRESRRNGHHPGPGCRDNQMAKLARQRSGPSLAQFAMMSRALDDFSFHESC